MLSIDFIERQIRVWMENDPLVMDVQGLAVHLHGNIMQVLEKEKHDFRVLPPNPSQPR